MKNELRIGDKVIVTDIGMRYSSYREMYDKMVKDNGPYPEFGGHLYTNKVYTVLCIENHPDYDDREIYLITDGKNSMLIEKDGLSKIDMDEYMIEYSIIKKFENISNELKNKIDNKEIITNEEINKYNRISTIISMEDK